MKISKRSIWFLIFCFGAGISMMIVVWNMDTTLPDTYAQPQAGADEHPVRNIERISSDPSFPAPRPQQRVATTPATVSRPDYQAPPSVSESSTPEAAETPPDENQIYTMSTLPQDKSGIYRVRDPDGNVIRIAVDVPGEDSPIGF